MNLADRLSVHIADGSPWLVSIDGTTSTLTVRVNTEPAAKMPDERFLLDLSTPTPTTPAQPPAQPSTPSTPVPRGHDGPCRCKTPWHHQPPPDSDPPRRLPYRVPTPAKAPDYTPLRADNADTTDLIQEIATLISACRVDVPNSEIMQAIRDSPLMLKSYQAHQKNAVLLANGLDVTGLQRDLFAMLHTCKTDANIGDAWQRSLHAAAWIEAAIGQGKQAEQDRLYAVFFDNPKSTQPKRHTSHYDEQVAGRKDNQVPQLQCPVHEILSILDICKKPITTNEMVEHLTGMPELLAGYEYNKVPTDLPPPPIALHVPHLASAILTLYTAYRMGKNPVNEWRNADLSAWCEAAIQVRDRPPAPIADTSGQDPTEASSAFRAFMQAANGTIVPPPPPPPKIVTPDQTHEASPEVIPRLMDLLSLARARVPNEVLLDFIREHAELGTEYNLHRPACPTYMGLLEWEPFKDALVDLLNGWTTWRHPIIVQWFEEARRPRHIQLPCSGDSFSDYGTDRGDSEHGEPADLESEHGSDEAARSDGNPFEDVGAGVGTGGVYR